MVEKINEHYLESGSFMRLKICQPQQEGYESDVEFFSLTPNMFFVINKKSKFLEFVDFTEITKERCEAIRFLVEIGVFNFEYTDGIGIKRLQEIGYHDAIEEVYDITTASFDHIVEDELS